MRSFTAVVNPTAGRDAPAKLIPVARLLRDAGAEVTVRHSRSLDDAADLGHAAAAAGDVVLAVGGDGMVGRLAGAVAAAGGVLGVVPAGRGNDFARHLGMPGDAAALAAILRDAPPVKADLIEVDGRTVAGSVYAGVDSLANVHINRSRLPASLAYHYGALRAMLEWRPATYRVTVDGVVHECTCYTVAAANAQFYGHGRRAAPEARIDDGLLDVIIFEHCSRRIFVTVAMREIYAGTHLRRSNFTVLRGRDVRIEADREVPVGADGELIGTLPVTVRVRPGVLQVLTATRGTWEGPSGEPSQG